MGFAAGLLSAARRWQVEARNRRVEITLDYTELRNLAANEGVPLPALLRRFRGVGATSVAVQEDTVGSLEDAGRVRVLNAGRQETYLSTDGGDFERVVASLENKTRFPVRTGDSALAYSATVEQPFALVRGVGVGLDPQTVREVRSAGLGVVGRVGNVDGVTPDAVRWTLQRLKQHGVQAVIFSGDSVLGFKGFVQGDRKKPDVPSTETSLRDLGMFYGTVEFVKQKGDPLLARVAQGRTVRVHTVSGAEMVSADVPSNVQRFLLAARERNIRLLFVRLFSSEPDPVKVNTAYVEKIARGLHRGGLSLGPAHGYGELSTPLALRLLMTVGLAGAWGLLLHGLTGLTTRVTRAVAWAGGLFLVALAAQPKLGALAAACVFPTLALVHRDLLAPVSERLSARGTLEYVFRRLLAASGITLLGAATVVGLLGDRVFLIKADAFAGIKFSQLVPLLAAAVVYFFGLWASADRPWPRVVADVRERVLSLAARPLLVWQVGAALVALVALALVVLRSGNDPGVGVSALELKVRGLLDRALYARPRFKEFLIGHPFFVVATGLAITARPRWLTLPLFLVGALGQVSLLNTFCHLHTPLFVSAWRALLALALGIGIGVGAYLLLDRLLRSQEHAVGQ